MKLDRSHPILSHRNLWPALALVLFIACKQETVVNSPALLGGAQNAGTNYQNMKIRWPSYMVQGDGLNLVITQNIQNQFLPADSVAGLNPIEQMAEEWNSAIPGLTFYKVPASPSTASGYSSLAQYQDGEMGVYKSTSWFSNVSSSALAITQFFGTRKNRGQANEYVELAHADVIFNYKNFEFSTDPNDFTKYDFHSVILHELGHFIGLPHEYDTWESIMAPSLGSYESQRSLYAADVTKLSNLYVDFEALTSSPQSAIRQQAPASSEPIQGVFELLSNGTCIHRINQVEVERHQVEL